MGATRIGSLSLVNDVLRDVTQSQTKLADLQLQISSGYKSDTFAGLNGSVEKFTQVTAQLSRAKQFNSNNQVNISKLQTADVALEKLVDIADQIKTNIMGANGATIDSSNLEQVIGDLLKAFGSELNTNFNGYYVFGGADSNTIPVPDTTVSNQVLGVPDSNYYVGSTQDTIMRFDERTEVAFPVRADDPAFQKIYAAARQAIDAAQRGNAEELQKAQQLIQDGQKDLNTARSRLGATLLNVQSVDDRLKQLQTHWTELADGVSKTDIVAASTEVAGYQAILQASFQVYARLSQLKLSDYL